MLRQPEETTVVADELQTKAVDGAEEGAAQFGKQRLPAGGRGLELLQHQVAGADPQFLRRQLAISDDDQPREHFRLPVAAQGQVGDAPNDGRRLAGPRPGRDAEVLVQALRERLARVGVE